METRKVIIFYSTKIYTIFEMFKILYRIIRHPGIPNYKHTNMMETVLHAAQEELSVKQKLQDILMVISWREIARTYFAKSSSWLYHKLDGIDGNGGKGDFTPAEKEQLKGALCDLADRIRKAADTI